MEGQLGSMVEAATLTLFLSISFIISWISPLLSCISSHAFCSSSMVMAPLPSASKYWKALSRFSCFSILLRCSVAARNSPYSISPLRSMSV